jgi:hypothetical protein
MADGKLRRWLRRAWRWIQKNAVKIAAAIGAGLVIIKLLTGWP